MTVTEPPELGAASDYALRLSCAFYGDQRIVHAARSHGIWVGRSTACGHWVWDRAIRRDGYPYRAAKPVSCTECIRVLVELSPWRARLDEIAALEDGWLDGDGKSVGGLVINSARRLLDALTRRQIPGSGPSVYPTPCGGVQLEWDRIDRALARFPDSETEVGIDLGLTHFAILSGGTKVDSPKLLRRAERKLKRLQQDLSRKQKGSNNRRKAVARVARAHARVADARRDFHHKLSTAIVAENQGVYVEDLNVAGLARSRLKGHAKSVHDAGWSGFTAMLAYKCARYGRAFAKVDRFAPTSQVCSACGVKDGPKLLDVREWTCSGCGAAHDRDVNAAQNVLHLGKLLVAAGRAETLNACGAQVRPGLVPAQRREAGTRRSDREAPCPAQ